MFLLYLWQPKSQGSVELIKFLALVNRRKWIFIKTRTDGIEVENGPKNIFYRTKRGGV